MDNLKSGILDQLAGAARYAATRNHPTAQPYYRHSMMFLKVAEEVGLVEPDSGNIEFPWKIDLSDDKVEGFYTRVAEQYVQVLELYESGTAQELRDFLSEHLWTTDFNIYVANAAAQLSEGQEMQTPADLAQLPEEKRPIEA